MRRQSSPARRYLIARLRPLTRPVFWAPAIVLMLVMLFTWEFWTRPEFLSYLGIQSGAETDENALSAEDRAIGADIDTLPLLLNDVGILANPASPDQSGATKSAPQPTNLANLQGIPIAGSTTNQAQPNQTQPNQTQLTPGLFGNLGNSPIPLQRSGFPNSVNNSGGQQPAEQTPFATQQIFSTNNLLTPSSMPSPLTQSPLQSPLTTPPNATTAENRPPLTPSSFTAVPGSGAPIEGTTSLGSFGVNATTPNNASATNSFTNLVEGSQPISGSQNSLSGGTPTTPSIAPPLQSSTPQFNPGQPLPTPGLGASPDAFAPQPSTQAIPANNIPLSAPRPIPGRFIGGGQINTFSNP
ncbi:hypothetical protein ACKFKF_31210 [Phormidesmis sp. 146-12]